MKTATSRLIQMGLSEYESRAYTALLKESPSTAYEIAKNSGIPTSKVYEVIKRLESRQMVQVIHGERSRMFIPQPIDEFLEDFRVAMEENIEVLKGEMKDLKGGIDISYTWHIKDYDGLIRKARRMLDAAERTILLSIWQAEVDVLGKSIIDAEARGVKVAVVHYGVSNLKIKQLYKHPIEETIYARRGTRGVTLVTDSREALIARVDGKKTEAIWSMNEGFVIMAEDYIRHDIYVMKIISRFDPLLKEKFGHRYERLMDIHTD